MNITLNTAVSELWKVGKVTASRLKKLGVETVYDLLMYYPFRYDDFSVITPIANIQPHQPVTIHGEIMMIANKKTARQGMNITEAMIQDAHGDTIPCIWFNQPYLAKTLSIGTRIALSGTPEYGYRNALQFTSPQYEKIISSSHIHTGRLVPIYPTTANLTQKQIRFLIQTAMESVNNVSDWIPDAIKTDAHLISRKEAIKEIHFPTAQSSLAKAERRLKFEELFLTQLLAFTSRNHAQQSQAHALHFHEDAIKSFVAGLPFILTDDQKKTAWHIIQDCEHTMPMNRLLEGDVGSGKTAVAAIAMLNCALNNVQAVLMAPTEILARQHFQTLMELFAHTSPQPSPCKGEGGISPTIALLTNSEHRLYTLNNKKQKTYTKKQIIQAIADGTAHIVLGTHALIQEAITFHSIGLAIIDEQHRFGVEQRKMLMQKSIQTALSPHFLSMTATPIPRSLALTVYGDLDLSVIKQMPKNRKPIITRIIHPADRNTTYEFIRSHIKQGRQAFVICPLIEESDTLGIKAATQEYERLSRDVFPTITVGLLHGKLKPKEKQEIQEKFSSGVIDILVATSVVEVGVNIPNATIMVIEGAERFGLAQLHQFRGRVGRAHHQSYCFLFTSHAEQKNRLEALVNTTNGFELAEIDLTLRGPGDMFGTRQSGLPNLRIASLTDIALIAETRTHAKKLFEQDPTLQSWPTLKSLVEEYANKTHRE
ncbi:MAG: ATP-dependent DNA helicase [Parcubacteria group bacterium GW2011_GWA2_43_13]|nr:MAG: ATP-dependent DNA helicase [Parcubacteria group bacterium GW2011_GWA2_43_13]